MQPSTQSTQSFLPTSALAFPPATPLLLDIAANLRPPERLPLSEWAERHIILSPEYSARTSNLRLFPWQREIFDSFTDPNVEEITLCCGTQLVKTLFIQCCMAYVIAEAPGPALMVYPKADDAKAFSKERIAPMLRDCPILRHRVSDSDRDGNTILTKEFPGGSISLVGAVAPGNLARRSIRYLFADEIDKYPLSAGREGDPVALAKERTATFRSRRKIVRACSPTIAGRSRISAAYHQSDQRKPYVPCWACGTMQVLKWSQVEWRKSGLSGAAHTHHPETARYICLNPDCRMPWDDRQRWLACQKAEWRAESTAKFKGHAGFWISHLYSPWKKLSEIATNYLESVQDREKRQVFINTNLAQDYEEQGDTTDPQLLYARRESYAYGDAAVVPMRGLFLTAAVDVQDSPPRLEVEVKAWGRGRENWSIDYRVIQVEASNGEPLPVTSRELWDKLDAEVLQRSYQHESGNYLPIYCIGIDTGNRPKPVYDFALRHPRFAYGPTGIKLHAIRTVIPVKGTDDLLKILSGVSKENAARKRQGIRILQVGTHCAKQELFDLLKHVKPAAADASSPGCYHFPMYERGYFEGLCSEVKVIHESGRIEYQKRQGPNTRNEPLDLAVYNRAMAAVVGIDRFGDEHWKQMERQLGLIDASGNYKKLGADAPTPPPTPAVSTNPAGAEASTQSAPSPIPAAAALPTVRTGPGPAAAPTPAPSRQLLTQYARRPLRGRF